jgi:hypothetical protein
VGAGRDRVTHGLPMSCAIHVQRVWKAFVEKVDEEEILLVMLTVNEVNKNKNVM